MLFIRLNLFLLTCLVIQTAVYADRTNPVWTAGFARVEVTPTEPVRMSGYGSRDHPSEGVQTPLHARCMAFKKIDSVDPPALLISVDNIGIPGSMTQSLCQTIASKHQIPRNRIVVCSTHTHSGPDLATQLSNIYETGFSAEELKAARRYTTKLERAILEVVDLALSDLQPARLSYQVGQATFAANRRVLKDGRWVTFGVQADGPVDHTVPVLRITDAGGKVRGVVFNYACHCTTLTGDHYEINADWAGYAATQLESDHPDSVALCTIGCGADANPEPRGTVDAAKIHGRTLAGEVGSIIGGDMQAIDSDLRPSFDYAALSFDLPTVEELTSRLKSQDIQERRGAQQLLDVLKRDGRLPASYPVPIQSWQFGNQLTMIFLGGEVVVDYAIRLKKTLHNPTLWVTAYANDVLGYIASERMRSEGGYEFDRSAVYYGLPGPWSSGSETLLIRSVLEMLQSQGRTGPKSTDEALKMFQISDGYKIELVASEPLVQDPINIAFDRDGRMWVVEMGDYPEDDRGGKVKRLSDEDKDGRYETATTFMDQLSYPTGVFPWRDGVLISVAPDILFARDTNDDGKADDIQKLYTGFRLANPQHRINGFSYAMDHSLHLASGDNLGELSSIKTGEKIDASGRDVQIWPDTGRILATSGRSQYIRSRNDWGQWFGNDNSRPMYHFPVDDRYLQRNSAVSYSNNAQQLFEPSTAPPVFAITTTGRFNDLMTANRFTSACSSIVARTTGFESKTQTEKPVAEIAFVCEPVHNLVHRTALQSVGASFRAMRLPEETSSEFLASQDPWFRPVRALVGPDGALYIVDMYRETIEHPEWIPEAWRTQLDLRAGQDRGRIYRITPTGIEARLPDLSSATPSVLTEYLRSPIGPLRDLAQQTILEDSEKMSPASLIELARDPTNPYGRVHALSILAARDKLTVPILVEALEDEHPGVLQVAIGLAGSRLQAHPELLDSLAKTAVHDDAKVVLQTSIVLGESDATLAGEILAGIASQDNLDRWIADAVRSSAKYHASKIIERLLEVDASSEISADDAKSKLLTDMLVTAHAGGIDVVAKFGYALTDRQSDLPTQMRRAGSFAAAFRYSKINTEELANVLRPLYKQAIQLMEDSSQDETHRCEALQLIGIGIDSSETEAELLLNLIAPNTPSIVQNQAIDRLAYFSDVKVSQHLVSRWQSMSKNVRDHCVGRMLERPKWTETLLIGLESGLIGVADISAATRQQLAHRGSRSMRVRAERLFRKSGSVEKRTLIQQYLAEATDRGDGAIGMELFKKHCSVCHTADERGQAVGASLANLTDRSSEALLTAILDPNRAVDPKYVGYVVQTSDGRVLAGAIEQEVGRSLTLAHADGKRTTVFRSDIENMKSTGVSLMPEGFEDVLSASAMRDLLAHLQK